MKLKINFDKSFKEMSDEELKKVQNIIVDNEIDLLKKEN